MRVGHCVPPMPALAGVGNITQGTGSGSPNVTHRVCSVHEPGVELFGCGAHTIIISEGGCEVF